MRLRSTFAMLTALLLLTISYVASACEATCDVKALGGGCHHSGSSAPTEEKQANHATSGMPSCDMATVEDGASKAPPEVVLSTGACCHQVCEQAPTVVPNETGISAQLIAAHQTAILAYVFFVSKPEILTDFRTPETPPLRTALLASLQSTLRV